MAKKLNLENYPDYLESWWIEKACNYFKKDSLEQILPQLQSAVQELSDLFTLGRTDPIRNYSKNERLLVGYGIFFFPQMYARTQFPISEILKFRQWNPTSNDTLKILDLGSGLGASGQSAAIELRNNFVNRPILVHSVDQSSLSLQWSEEMRFDLRNQLKNITFQHHVADYTRYKKLQSIADNIFDLIIFSYSINEVIEFEDTENIYNWLLDLSKQLSPNGLLCIIEPALCLTSERLEKLRNHISEKKEFFIWGPCLHSEKCPLLNEQKFWCQEVKSWNPPKSMELVNRKLWRSIRELKFSFLIIGKNSPKQLPNNTEKMFRLISPVSKMKGKYLMTGCAADGQKHVYDLQTRHLDRRNKNLIEEIERGDIIKLKKAKTLGDKYTHRIENIEDLEIIFDPKK